VYRNAWMTVREDTVRRQDGTTGIYGVVDKPDFALVLPRHERGFWLVEQYRYPVRRRSWEFPRAAGGAVTRGRPTSPTPPTQLPWLGPSSPRRPGCGRGTSSTWGTCTRR